jgi:hypothetical protein
MCERARERERERESRRKKKKQSKNDEVVMKREAKRAIH